MAKSTKKNRLSSQIQGQSRVIIESMSPEIDNGAFPVKRAIGEEVKVQADIYAEGHDSVSAQLLYKKRGSKNWQTKPMQLLENDRWEASFRAKEKGFYQYTVHAWSNFIQTWQNDLRKKKEASLDLKVDLKTGIQAIEKILSNTNGYDIKKVKDLIGKIKKSKNILKAYQYASSEILTDFSINVPHKNSLMHYPKVLEVYVERPKALFSSWYEFFPRSFGQNGKHGTFKDCERILPEIARMGFNIIYLPPIHPIGYTKRKGKNNAVVAARDDVGSPWAIGSKEGGHKSIHPKLGTMKEFQGFIKKAEVKGIDVAIDIALQCSVDHPYINEHPEWFNWRPDGTIQYAENPPKKYEDIVPINFATENWQELWEELKSIFIFWIKKGIHIFRVDNPHTKPFIFWKWVISEIKKEYPDVIFLSEAFTRPKVMQQLAKLGFTQSYTYFTWRTSKSDFLQYMHDLTQTDVAEYFRPNFWPNTPDILPVHLQTGGRPAFIARLVLASTLSSNFGMYGPAFELCINDAINGKEEYIYSEKYEIKNWDWDRPGNLKDLIAILNDIRKKHPALQRTRNIHFFEVQNDQMLGYLKANDELTDMVLIFVNLDPHNVQSAWVNVPLKQMGINSAEKIKLTDLITGDAYTWQGEWNFVQLNPYVLPAHIFEVKVVK